MISQKDIWAIQERNKDMLRAAQQERIARLARSNGARRALHYQALAWLGRRLVALGVWLEARYGVVPSAPRLRRMQHGNP